MKRSLKVAASASLALVGPVFLSTATASAAPIDYSDTVQVSWDGKTYEPVTSETFFKTPTLVPGDTDSRTLWVKNVGPCSGTLTGSIVNVQLKGYNDPDVHHNPEHQDPDPLSGDYKGAGDQGNFYDDLKLQYTTSEETKTENFRSLDDNGSTTIVSTPIEKNDVEQIDLAYLLPKQSTSGNLSNVERREATFDLKLDIKGDKCKNDNSGKPKPNGPGATTPGSNNPNSSGTNNNTPGANGKSADPSIKNASNRTGPVSNTSRAPMAPSGDSSESGPRRVNTDNEQNRAQLVVMLGLGLLAIGSGIVGFLRAKRENKTSLIP